MTDTRTEIESLPSDIQEYIRELRDEAAKHRTAKNVETKRADEFEQKYAASADVLKAANEKLDSFGTVTDAHEKLLADNAGLQSQFTRLKVAVDYGIPAHAHRLSGDTEEELREDAKSFAEQVGLAVKAIPVIPIDRAAGEQPVAPLTDVDGLIAGFKEAGIM